MNNLTIKMIRALNTVFVCGACLILPIIVQAASNKTLVTCDDTDLGKVQCNIDSAMKKYLTLNEPYAPDDKTTWENALVTYHDKVDDDSGNSLFSGASATNSDDLSSDLANVQGSMYK